MRAWVALSIALALLGCGGDDAPAPTRERGPFAAAAPPTTTSTSASDPRIGRTHREIDSLDHGIYHPAPPSSAATTTHTEIGPGEASTAPEGRNYGAELAVAVGSPASCMDAEIARTLHGRLSIQVTATVTPSGTVTRATASGASLPERVLTCVQTRALNAHLAAPVEGAPRTLSTVLTFDVTTTDDTVTHETPVWHQPGAVAEPGHVLPAVGAEGRPSGSVEPDSTLPARGTGSQEGRVAPDVVTPAVGGGGTIWPSTP
jgi:hypothetical protein